jgi:adenylyltransferase/sulfurtransferase
MPGNNPNLSRHARHLALAQIGAGGQERISASTVLLIGVGGIGCATASYLASSGVGHLLLCDFDTIDATNLGRQILYGPDDVGKQKAQQAAVRLAGANPDIQLTAIIKRLDDAALAEAVAQSDVVLDASDNFATRFQVNDACISARTCLISGAAIRLEGQLAVFGPDFTASSCYRCLYEEADESLQDCAGNGVLAPVPGAIGTLMAAEALKFLAGIRTPSGVLRLFDAASGEFRSVTIAKRDDCPACGK